MMVVLCVILGICCLDLVSNVKSSIYSVFWDKWIWAAPNNFQRNCSPPHTHPSWSINTCIMFSPYGHSFHCSEHCICLWDAPWLYHLCILCDKTANFCGLQCVQNCLLQVQWNRVMELKWCRTLLLLLVVSVFDPLFCISWASFLTACFSSLSCSFIVFLSILSVFCYLLCHLHLTSSCIFSPSLFFISLLISTHLSSFSYFHSLVPRVSDENDGHCFPMGQRVEKKGTISVFSISSCLQMPWALRCTDLFK